MRYIFFILLFCTSLCSAQSVNMMFWKGSADAAAGPDTLELTYWDDFILLHIADTGITEDGNGVSEWQDRSGNGNHSTQSVNANKPTTDGSGNVVFDGTDDYLEMAEFWNSGNNPDSSFTIFIVGQVSNTTSTVHKIFDYAQGNDSLLVYVYMKNVDASSFSVNVGVRDVTENSDWQSDDLDTLNEGTIFLVTIAASETSSTQVRINSVEKSSYVNDGDWTGAGSGRALGSKRTYDDQFIDATMGFYGVAPRKFTASEISTTESELNTFFTIY